MNKGRSLIIRLIRWKSNSTKRANNKQGSLAAVGPIVNNYNKRLARTGSGEVEVPDIKWEVRPGGMLVQKRDHMVTSSSSGGRRSSSNSSTDTQESAMMRISIIQVSAASHWHHISIDPTSTFGELKDIMSIVTGLEPREQRLLYRGKQREDDHHLHMVGVSGGDKVLLLQDPAFKDTKMQLNRRSSFNIDHSCSSAPLENVQSRNFQSYCRNTTIKGEDKENPQPTRWKFGS